jgi:predicted DNA-binding protein (UPF0251 family)
LLVDPSEMDRRFAAAEPQGEEDEDPPKPVDVEAKLLPLLARIPRPEAEILRLYFIAQKKQRDIAAIYGVTQAAISYRLHRALHRLRFVASLPPVDACVMRDELGEVLDVVDVAIVMTMTRTTCETATAAELVLSAGLVRHRFARAVQQLAEAADDDARFAPYRDLVQAIASRGRLLLRERRHRNFVYSEAA